MIISALYLFSIGLLFVALLLRKRLPQHFFIIAMLIFGAVNIVHLFAQFSSHY